ncbi:uncharacterized protein LOC119172481 isoform X2 [Rhipicephalus microplus]|uniref:uncharacterized protein LOC119172481 isoform X2 n=1 Tax=Rhipicephalus microplus TaxID=6941 RepID=UPI0018884892|nr:uncharacterized protein LOC119172481 isoform X2 [Rhipicephalus microplus]
MSRAALAWLFLAGAALGSPSCHISSRNTTASVTCADFGSAMDFEHYIQRPLSRPTLSFVLRDSRLDRLPAGAFIDVSATSLELSNVTVETFEFAEEDNPFAGLRTSVENMTFSDNSTLPPSWAILADMESLRSLTIVDAVLNLTSDFGALPAGMLHVTVESAVVSFLDDWWLAQLTNLESVTLRNTDVSQLKRSIMARPAVALRNLDLSEVYRGVSLNDVLLTGPDFTSSLNGRLIRFRKERVAVIYYKQQICYNFLVQGDHHDFLRFLWFYNNDISEDIV